MNRYKKKQLKRHKEPNNGLNNTKQRDKIVVPKSCAKKKTQQVAIIFAQTYTN